MTSGAELSQRSAGEEDILRANGYGLLAALLARPPGQEILAKIAALKGDQSPMGQAFSALGGLARKMSPPEIADEYHTLFIGLGRGEILPYGSYYLTGFLHEKPLARLRNAMAELGIERDPAVKEPEDHIAALMDMMGGLVLGKFSGQRDIAEQRRFFDAHIGNWAPHMFADLEKAKSAVFYRPVGTIGRLLMEIERAAFEMA